VRWVSDSRWGARLTGPVTLAGDYVDLEGFDVSGGSSNVLVELAGNYTRAIGNHVHDLPIPCTSSNGGAGIDATGVINGGYNGHGEEITGNVVSDVGAGPRDGSCRTVHAIYSAVPDVRIVNNLAVRATGWGIHLWHAATRNTIVNNTIYDTGAGGIIVGSGDNGSTAAGDTGTYVANNVISTVSGAGIAEEGANVGFNTYVDNLVFNAPYAVSISATSTETGTLVADPLFVAPLNADYHLQAGSPAVDTGTATNAPPVDLDGTPRPQGAGYDRGAYERRTVTGARAKARILRSLRTVRRRVKSSRPGRADRSASRRAARGKHRRRAR
jgi:parallel beta-helix repeat protein